MTLDLIRERKDEVAHPAPPAVHLFGAIPHDPPCSNPAMRRSERDHFAAHFVQNFAAALTEAKMEPLVG
ncbi:MULTISPECIES: hypothetical protein [Novosphingobium]|uniref:hypothetical protein n=1 Tax=Novosphingobium TaxID=165696 RepID=UPI001CD2C812|nr:hypothetical protein [Novosphingobium percolationis]MCH7629811.1 hypothetical protein [Pseudomonadota bacterium]